MNGSLRINQSTASSLSKHNPWLVFTRLVVITLLVTGTASAQRPSQKKPAPPKRPAPAEAEPLSGNPQEEFERAKSAPTAQERIALLERFIKSFRGSEYDLNARELLMREYALQGEQALREANPQQAVRAFKSAFRVTPAIVNDRIFGQYIFPLPLALNAFGYRVEAADLMRAFEPKFQDQPNRLVEIGFFYVQIEAPIEAVRVLERAVQLAPDDHRAHNSLGSAYLINLRLEDAADQFTKALELDAKDEYANLNLGHLARGTGDYQRAIGYYRKQLAIKSDDAEARGGLAIALLAVGRDEDAEGEIKRAFELAPADYRFPTQLAFYYMTRNKPSLARPLIERAAQIEPRYIWMHITKASIDTAEGKYGDALSTLIAAQSHGLFPTLTFEIARALMALDGYDQAIDIMKKSFRINEDNEFEAMLAGAVRARSPRLDLLLERERKASIFLNDQIATQFQYRLCEALERIDYNLNLAVETRKAEQESTKKRNRNTRGKASDTKSDELQQTTRPRRTRPSEDTELSAGKDSALRGVAELMADLKTFTTMDDGRQAFRMVWASRKLTDSGIALDAAEQLARRAIVLAEAATEPGGSMRDAPLLDREGRKAVFLGRAYDALGWALLKKGDARGAVGSLSKAVEIYPENAERKTAIWHLAVASEEVGDERRALELYIASYDAGQPTSLVRRARIESLYKKINGSLAGLDDKLKNQ